MRLTKHKPRSERDATIPNLGVTFPPTNMEWNVREFHVRHLDDHVFRISQGIGED